MSQYNEASVQVHCSPLFGVFWGLCGHLSAPEEFGGSEFCYGLTVDSAATLTPRLSVQKGKRFLGD